MKDLWLYNSLSGRKELFKPVREGKVSIYTCGLTVQDYTHIGHARMDIIWDVFKNILRRLGYEVYHVQNFTDINEKIAEKALELKEDPLAYAQRYIDAYFSDIEGLEVKGADVYCKASDNIEAIQDVITKLIDKGHAYASQGNVYFRVESDPHYGSLSGRKTEEMQSGARIAVQDNKENPADFALWTVAQPGEPIWDSPWGPGTPGWHIECTAMSCKYLGDLYDLHGGGLDILFPHHENELAQGRCACSSDYVNYWIHHGMINLPDGEKMSKSLDNFFRVKDLLEQVPGYVLRFFVLSAHYRSPIVFTKEVVEQSQASLARLVNTHRRLRGVDSAKKNGDDVEELLNQSNQQFWQDLLDDFNTAGAIGRIFELSRKLNALLDQNKIDFVGAQKAITRLADWFDILGLKSAFVVQDEEETLPAELAELIEKRNQARKNRDWATADSLRDQLEEAGIILKDTAQGVTWQRKK
ncbi:MAG: cysteine--tRNA ligase [Firmicutes bacterium]|jgi:cysteinyl-tRNA synthetase|nr:cysteine--tRNA ligase [Bacillota bacterium]